MKQLLFLLLFPCLALAQYTGNAGQKITLGEQTSADGLVFRGNAADTVAATLKITKTNKSDTSAFLLLDTINNVFLKYNIGTTYWTRLNILPTDTASMLGNYWRSGRFSGVLPVENGGTGATTFTEGSVVFAGAGGTYTQDNSGIFFDNTNNRLGINTAAPLGLLEARSTVGGTNNGLFSLYESSATSPYFTFRKARGTVASPSAVLLNDGIGDLTFSGYAYSTFNPAVVLRAFNYLAPGAAYLNGGFKILINSQANGGLVDYLNIISNGNVGIGDGTVPTERLHIGGNARITAVGTASASNSALYITNTGVLSTNASDVNKKHNVRNLPYGLSTINNLNPVAFEWNETDETDIGFIAQDIESIIPESVITNWDSELIFRQEKIIPVLVKAIQEQQALIKALEQRILILENK